MARLLIDHGFTQKQVHTLEREKTVLGRSPDCEIVISDSAVSRWHALIVRVGDAFFIEDLKSRNGTYVNLVRIKERTQLQTRDEIRVCDFQAMFELVDGDSSDKDSESSSTITASVNKDSDVNLDKQPADKLATMLQISESLVASLQLEVLFPAVADGLFRLFHQADRCFIIFVEPETGRFIPKHVKTRRTDDENKTGFSWDIIRQCLERNQGLLFEDASKQHPTNSVLANQIRSIMSIPLVTATGKPFGVIQLDTLDASRKFSEEDLKLFWGVTQQASLALENAQLHTSLLLQERHKRDLELARVIQRNFLPQSVPEVPGYEFFAHYEAAQEVGGDYYDFIPLADGLMAVILGDVAGKGVAAALLMAKLSSEARYCLLSEPRPAPALCRLNALLCPCTGPMDRFVTLALLVLDPSAHTLTLVSAGHPAPLLLHKGTARLTESMPRDGAGLPLGMVDVVAYETFTVSLAPGDQVLLFSDGVLDAQSVSGKAFLAKGIHDAIRGCPPKNVDAFGKCLVDAINEHAIGRPQYDDITLVCLGRTR